MKAEEFREWRFKMRLNRSQAATELGLGRNMPQKYEDGKASIPHYIALACAALMRGIAPWPK